MTRASRTLLCVGVTLVLLLSMLPAGVVASHSPSHNNAPVIDPVADIVSPEKKILHVEITASDADFDNLIFEAVKLPAGADFQQNTTTQAYLKWIPSYTDAGSHEVTIKVRDEHAADTESFNINVTDVNRAPYLDVIRNDWIDELEEHDFQLKAYDPDTDDFLNYSIESIPTADHNTTALPDGVRFADGNDNNAGFAWTPDCTQGAPFDALNGGGKRYQFRVNVTDGEANHSRQFNLTVYHVDTPPELGFQPFRLGVEGTTLKFAIFGSACDSENHTLEVGLLTATQAGITPPPLPSPLPNKELPVGASVVPEHPDIMLFDAVNETYFSNFTWEIHFQQAGNYTFYSNMSDPAGNSDNESFTIKIRDHNTAPEFDVFPEYHDPPNATFWGKEDTRFNMTAPLGSYLGEGCFWPSNDVYPIPCGTPFVANVTDEENDLIFWNLDWLEFDGKAVSGDVLPANLRFFAPGINNTTGQAGDPDTPAVPANETFALLRWVPDYDQAGSYKFRLWATDGANVTEQVFFIKVENTNRLPFIEGNYTEIVWEGQPVEFDVRGYDRDFLDVKPHLRDDVELSASPLPPGSQFQPGRDEQSIFFHGNFNWTPDYHQAGLYLFNISADDSPDEILFPDNPLIDELVNPPPARPTVLANITVLNVDRSPVLDPIPDTSYQQGATVNLLVHAEDPDGDGLTVTATGLPSAVSLVNDSAGPGWFDGRLFGTALDGGVHPVTVEACSGFPAVCVSQTFLLIVIVDTDFEIHPDSTLYKTVPGADVLIPLRVANTGPANPDVINFGVSFEGTIVSFTPNVTVASTEGEWANLTVRAPPGFTEGTVIISAASTIDPSFVKIAKVKVVVDLEIDVQVTQTVGGVQGFATVLFGDGTPVVTAPATATQSPNTNPFGTLSTSVSGFVNSTGQFNFAFGATDARATAPGTHTLTVGVEYGGVIYEGTTTYTI